MANRNANARGCLPGRLNNLTNQMGHDALLCCHPDCYAPSLPDMARSIPLCEHHIFTTYRATNKMLGTKTGMSQEYELLPAGAEYIPGPCPACGVAGLLVGLANGIVKCQVADCDYSQSRNLFGAQRKKLMSIAAAESSVVYYMALGNRVKIGTSKNLAKRILTFNPEDCLAFEPGGRKLERDRHDQFNHLRVVGEWFAQSPELVQHINGLTAVP